MPRRRGTSSTWRSLVFCLLVASWTSLACSSAKYLDPSQDTSARIPVIAYVVSGSEEGVADGMYVIGTRNSNTRNVVPACASFLQIEHESFMVNLSSRVVDSSDPFCRFFHHRRITDTLAWSLRSHACTCGSLCFVWKKGPTPPKNRLDNREK